ncbi:MAG: hypothetical protein IKG58_01905 [Bacilli bacterium]|nr:hypothetical protein [Bacilli bacterium]
MKKYIFLIILLLLLGFTVWQKENIVKFYNRVMYKFQAQNVKLGETNKYYRNYNFDFVQNTKSFEPHSRQDILNIYYTVINAGKDRFSFYCPPEYEECIDEINYLANDQTLLSHINNFVHPFNGFKNVETEYNSLGKVTIKVKKSYTKKEIKDVEKKVNEIEKEVIDKKKSTEDNIKNVHDYIINHSKYDSERSDNNVVNYRSDIAYGPLVQGYGLCGGYTDAMELFLEKLNVKSYKISSENHVWNAVYINNAWKHLDLTWDDPVTSDKSDMLEHNFFLIDTKKLKSLNTGQHVFELTIYKEFK